MCKKIIYLFLVFFLVSCGNTINNRKMSSTLLKNIKNKNFEEAIKNTKHKDFYFEENSALLKKLEIATLYYLKGDYVLSLKYFEQAKKISDDLYTIRIKNKIAQTWNPNSDIYYGENYEKSLIRFYISLINYILYQNGGYETYKDYDGNEILSYIFTNKEKQFHLNYSRTAIIEWDSFLQSLQMQSFNQAIFKNDMMAKIWGSFIHSEMQTLNDNFISIQLYKDAENLLIRNYNIYSIFNEKNSLFISDFKKLPSITFSELNRNYIQPTNYNLELQEFLVRNRKNMQNYKKDNLVVILKDGFIAEKQVKTINIPILISNFSANDSHLYDFAFIFLAVQNNEPYITIEIPTIIYNNEVNKYNMVVYNKDNKQIAKTNLIMIEPLSAIAKQTLEDDLAKITAANTTRVVAKYITAMASAGILYNQENYLAKVGAIALFASSVKIINESSRADIRYWSTLPSTIQMCGVILENGKYKIEILSSNNVKVFEKDVEIKNGIMKLIDINL